eukprot:jgi/Mesvir1/24617/Mv24152-RA.1
MQRTSLVAADSTPTEQAAEVSAAPASPSLPSGQAAGMEAYDAYTLVEQPDLFWAPIHAVEVQAATRGKQARALPSFLPTTGNGEGGPPQVPSFQHRSRQVQLAVRHRCWSTRTPPTPSSGASCHHSCQWME